MQFSMSLLEVLAFIVLLLIYKAASDEVWTIMQIIRSFFLPKVNLKKKYGEWAAVTGCTDGIGKAYTFQLAKRGINVVLISRNPQKLEQVSDELKTRFDIKTKIIVADFSKGPEVYKNIENGLQETEIGILVNNVGMFVEYPKYFAENSETEIRDLISININAVTLLTRLVLPGMIERKKGAIVNLSSASKLQPLPLVNLYAASKIFIDYFTEGLRNEYRNYGITCQVLCPYFVRTKILEFSNRLSKANVFVPDADTYAKHAIETLGIVDNTTGYWPHRFQYLVVSATPMCLRTLGGGIMSRIMRREYLKQQQLQVHPEVITTEPLSNVLASDNCDDPPVPIHTGT